MIGLLILFSMAGALTSVWLGGAVVYVSRSLGWDNLLTLPPSDLALFVFGALGPVAALWLVVGFVQNGLASHRQEKVLRTLAGQARQTAGQTEGQVRTLIQMQQESRRRSLIDGMDLVLKDLTGQAAILAERLGMVSEDEADTLWARTVSGDVWAFAYAFLTRAVAYPEFPDLLAERLAQDDISTGALQIFRRRYDMLVTSFEHTDADKVVRAVLEDGPLARLNELFRQVDHRATVLRLEEGTETVSGAVSGTVSGRHAVWAEEDLGPDPDDDDVAAPEPWETTGAEPLGHGPHPEPQHEPPPQPAPQPDMGPPPEPEAQPEPDPRFVPASGPLPPEAEAIPPFTPLSVDGESMEQSMARLQDALHRMNQIDEAPPAPDDQPGGEAPPALEAAAQDTPQDSVDDRGDDLLSRLGPPARDSGQP